MRRIYPDREQGFLVNYRGKFVTLDKVPWWKKDKYGWPIETVMGHPFRAVIRIIFQNIRKVTG